MNLSIVIVNWNTREALRDCLASIRRSELLEKFETIVVDNASADGSAEMVDSEFPEVLLFAETKNHGYARGNNLGFKQASGEYILTLNSDTILKANTLQLALDALRAKPSYGAIGAKLIGIDGKTQRSIRGFPSFAGIMGDALGLGRNRPMSRWDSYRLNGYDYMKAGDAPQPMGTFLLFRRSALQAIGDVQSPFDEDFPIFFNEVDLLFRLYRHDFPCWYDPKIEVTHLGGESTRQVRKSMIWESHRSLLRYFRKHIVNPLNFPIFALFSLGVWLGALVRARGFDAGFRT